MNEQKESPPQSVPHVPNIAPAIDTSKIYPDASKNGQEINKGRAAADIAEVAKSKTRNYPPLGVIVLSLIVMISSGYSFWLSLRKPGIYTVINSLQFLLGLGLLSLREMARLIYVALGIIGLVLRIPILLFISTIGAYPSYYRLYVFIIVLLQIAIIFYLTRPSVKDHFS